MKFIYLMTAIAGFFTAVHGVSAGPATDLPANEEVNDTTLAVIAWFDKRDTVTYWIEEANWKVNGKDTVKTTGVSTKVMITVTDSTRKGYRMEYKFLDFQCDTLTDPTLDAFQRNVVNLLSDRLTGASIRFRTNEYGHITKYDNLGQIRKRTKGLCRSVMQEMMNLPWADSLKSVGIDLEKMLGKSLDDGALVDGFTEDLEELFSNHATSFPIGDFDVHTEATEDEYESYTNVYIGQDPDSMEYEIVTVVTTVIPSADLKELLSGLYDYFQAGESGMEDLGEEYDRQITEDATVMNFHSWSYFADGWPQEYESYSEFKLMDSRKFKQKRIIWNRYNVGNH